MANRDNHYEAAFEAWLRQRRTPYVAVDEARRALAGDGSLKSLDFIVSPAEGESWLVDVKGRKFPSGDEQKQYWKNWAPSDDLDSLLQWESLFGAGFTGLLMFAYWLTADRAPLPADELFDYADRRYAFIGIRLSDYRQHARPISQRWDTVAMPTATFRAQATPAAHLFGGAATPAPD